MKFKILLYSICIIALFLVQSTFLEYLKVFNIKPNLIIIFIVSIALLKGNVEGAAVGFFCGIMQDMFSGKTIGLYALLVLFTGLLIGSVNKSLYRENFFVITFFTILTSLLYEFLIALVNRLVTDFNTFIEIFWIIILPEAIYNCVISVFMYVIIIKLNEKLNTMYEVNRKY